MLNIITIISLITFIATIALVFFIDHPDKLPLILSGTIIFLATASFLVSLICGAIKLMSK